MQGEINQLHEVIATANDLLRRLTAAGISVEVEVARVYARDAVSEPIDMRDFERYHAPEICLKDILRVERMGKV